MFIQRVHNPYENVPNVGREQYYRIGNENDLIKDI